jgi:hypothetical protein
MCTEKMTEEVKQSWMKKKDKEASLARNARQQDKKEERKN